MPLRYGGNDDVRPARGRAIRPARVTTVSVAGVLGRTSPVAGRTDAGAP